MRALIILGISTLAFGCSPASVTPGSSSGAIAASGTASGSTASSGSSGGASQGTGGSSGATTGATSGSHGTSGSQGTSSASAASGSSGASSSTASSSSGGSSGTVALPQLNADVVGWSVAAGKTWCAANSAGDLYCNDDGHVLVLAMASYSGDTSADAALLAQMRYIISGGREPFGNGGFLAELERDFTAMFAIAKQTPRVWSQLTTAEVQAIDLVMTGTLVGSAFTTSDVSAAAGTPVAIDGDTNLDRDWNPNYREGMIGGMIVGTLYFGGRGNTEALLAAFDQASFVTQLQAAGLTNMAKTYSAYTDASNAAPSPATVLAGITNYQFKTMTLDQLLDIYNYLATDSFGETVDCGLNGGTGISLGGGQFSGYLTAGCAQLPNLGTLGMLKEFNSQDANGQRSATFYAYDGFEPDLANQLVMLVDGAMPLDSSTQILAAQMDIGVTDYTYKVIHGYRDYAKGHDYGVTQLQPDGGGDGFVFTGALWREVVRPAHGL